MIQIELGDIFRQPLGVGQTGAVVLGGIFRDSTRLSLRKALVPMSPGVQ